MSKTRAASAGAPVAALLLVAVAAALMAGGCVPVTDLQSSVTQPKNDPNSASDPNDPNGPTCKVEFANASPYDATVTYFIGTADQRFETALLGDYTRRHNAVVPARQTYVSDPIPCAQVMSIKLKEVRFDLGDSVTAVGASGIFLQGEDYECEDTFRFVMDYRIHSNNLTIDFVVPPDCNKNHVPDDEDIASGTSLDCNGNGIPDECDIATGTSADENGNGVPDECEQK